MPLYGECCCCKEPIPHLEAHGEKSQLPFQAIQRSKTFENMIPNPCWCQGGRGVQHEHQSGQTPLFSVLLKPVLSVFRTILGISTCQTVRDSLILKAAHPSTPPSNGCVCPEDVWKQTFQSEAFSRENSTKAHLVPRSFFISRVPHFFSFLISQNSFH